MSMTDPPPQRASVGRRGYRRRFLAIVLATATWPAGGATGGARLPPPLVASDGHPIRTADEWFARRRPEILELFRTHVYGRAPVDRPDSLAFETVERDVPAFDGLARRTRLSVVYRGPGGSGGFGLLVYAPAVVPKPKACIVMIVNRGRATLDEAETKPSGYWPVEDLVRRGYATAGFDFNELAPDDKADGLRSGVFSVFAPSGSSRTGDAWAAVGAWAWGASRAIDALEREPGLTGVPFAVAGHSRGGKTALWCGAQDERIALTISNDSGSTGAALARTKRGETIADINRAFPHWFATNYRNFNDREADLPVDQHLLVAVIAPRLVYIAAAFDNHRADPLAQFQAGVEASPVYRLLGKTGLAADTLPPRPNVPLHDGEIGYHAHDGLHRLDADDWRMFMDFADRHLPSVQPSPPAAQVQRFVIQAAANPSSRAAPREDATR